MQLKIIVLIQKISLWLLIVSPVLYVPFVLFPYVAGKLLIICFAMIIFVSAWLWHLGAIKSTRVFSFVHWLFIAFVVSMIISTVFGIDVSQSFWGSIERGGGVWFWILLLLLFFCVTDFLRNESGWRPYLFGIVAVGVLTLLPAFGAVVARGFHRVDSVFGNPILFGNYLLFPFFIALERAIAEKTIAIRAIMLMSATALGLGIFMTETRGVFVGLFAGLCVAGLGFGWVSATRTRRILKYVLGVALFLIAWAFIFKESTFIKNNVPIVYRMTHIFTLESSTNQRLIIWRMALSAAKDAPFFGLGPENFSYAFDAHYNPALTRYGFTQTWADRSHNIVLDILVTQGVIGFALFFVLFGFMILYTIRLALQGKKESVMLMGALVAYIVQGLFAFDGPSTTVMLVIIFSYSVARYHTERACVLQKFFVRPMRVCGVLIFCTGIFVLYRVLITTNAYLAFETIEKQRVAERLAIARVALSPWSPYRNNLRLRFGNAVFETIGTVSKDESKLVLENGEKELMQAIKEKTRSLALRFTLGNLYTKATLHIDNAYGAHADQVLKDALPLSPTRQALYLQRANIAILQKDFIRAAELLREAKKIAPDVPQVVYYYGLALLFTDRIDEALAELFIAFTTPIGTNYYLPDDMSELQKIAKLAIEKKYIPLATIMFARMAHVDPHNNVHWENLEEALQYPGYPTFVIQYILNDFRDDNNVFSAQEWERLRRLQQLIK